MNLLSLRTESTNIFDTFFFFLKSAHNNKNDPESCFSRPQKQLCLVRDSERTSGSILWVQKSNSSHSLLCRNLQDPDYLYCSKGDFLGFLP